MSVVQSKPKTMNALIFTLSAIVLVRIASVTTAKASWNAMNAKCGIVKSPQSMPTFLNPRNPRSPINPATSEPNDRL